MAKRDFTTEELTYRWECSREIENLMGRRTFLGALRQSGKMYDEHWCKKAPDPSLGFNDGYYQGYEAVEGYYRAVEDLTKLKTELVKKANPQLADKSDEEIYGIGSLVVNNLTTPIIEIASDFKTAKGLWYYMQGETDYFSSGAGTFHRWGWLGADFVNEDGEWKIWHMIIAEDLLHRAGTSWAEPQPVKPVLPEYAAIDDFKLPEPNVPKVVYERWYNKRRINPFPEVPQPYDAFAETFSYGI